jgi:hypothetical protein
MVTKKTKQKITKSQKNVLCVRAFIFPTCIVAFFLINFLFAIGLIGWLLYGYNIGLVRWLILKSIKMLMLN